MSTVQTISQVEEFRELHQEWNHLLQCSHENNIFLTWEWLFAWWHFFGENSKLFILLVRDDDGALVGAAPLFIRNTTYYKVPVRQLTFIGIGHSDRQDFIYEKHNENVVLLIVKKIKEYSSLWDISVFEEIPNASSTIKKILQTTDKVEFEDASLCPFVNTEGDVEAFIKGYSKKFRRDLQHKSNRLKRYGKVTTSLGRENITIESMIEEMRIVERDSRKQGSDKLFWNIENNRLFFANLCDLFKLNEIADYCRILVDEKPIAYLFGFVYGGKYYAYNMAFDENFYDASPGKLLLNEKIKWCFGEGRTISEFDFLRGSTYLKALWASEDRQHIRVVLFNGTIKGEILRLLVFRVRPWLKRISKNGKEK